MRFVLKDRGCVFCRQDNAQVYFTRFMGDYTARLGPEDFDKLQARADRRELFTLPEINGYFDDEKHFQGIRALCGFTHPVLESGPAKAAPKFNNFNALKKHIESTLGQFFCDVCVKGRKVFLSEQLVYSKDALRRHQETGDESGPLAESGFKGHPPCKFCRTRFYDSNDLYRHMEGSHEHCFLCRRAAPDKYVYFRHYKVDHFTKDHHPCPHPTCLERKFVVFNTDYELKAHFAAEHGDEVKMSAAQRRQALTIPLQLQYRSRDDEETEPGPSARLERAAIVIGGGHNIGSRAARSGRGAAGGMHHSRSEPQIAQPTSTSGQDGPTELTFNAEDFPAPSSSQQAGAGPLGRWAAFAGTQASAGNLSGEDFPALPTMSKNQRRRIKEQQRTLAERLSAAAQPPRVLNRAGPGPAGGGAAAAGASSGAGQVLPGSADFPALRAAAPQAAPPPAPAAPPASVSSSSFVAARAADVVAPVPANRRPPGFGQEEFPALGGRAKARQAPPPPLPTAVSGYSDAAAPSSSSSLATSTSLSQTDVLHSLFMRPGSAAAIASAGASDASASAAAADAAPQLNAEDFPSLPGGRAKGRGAKVQLSKASPAKAQVAAVPDPAPAASSAGGGGGGGVSDSLKAANKALVERIKRQLSGAAFDTFKQQSMLFMRGELAADEYHDYMVSLGLLSLVAELVSLCPDTTKRRLLLDVHRVFICSPAAQDPALVGAGWMPPEAAVAKANRVAQHSSWTCQRCGLCNAPDDGRCESCRGPRPSDEEQLAAAAAAVALGPGSGASAATAASRGVSQLAAFMAAGPSGYGSGTAPEAARPVQNPPAADDFPPLFSGGGRRGAAAAGGGSRGEAVMHDAGGGGEAAAAASPSGAKGKKGKGTTIKIGLPTSGGAGGSGGSRPHPQNVWTQPAFKAKAGNSWSGQGAGKLNKLHGAINDAWGE
ncbi:hypothetical protein PLESTB_001479000 [Pleodorina starrii]|uniref:RanBP2-type domain-containing protein n=1 Tax=Pleodorina starrii TaxID=330485 RepID=A0A9W6F7N9_9CHLO|nr:hypothetical protein PLESTB_001479000 [Pleodorina starrii]GLC74432.1 hypothetical protein PLESTF_001512300 [Pleodorina starrii]